MLLSIDTIIQGAVGIVSAIESIGTVDDRKHGASTWSVCPGPGQSYVILDHERSEIKTRGQGGVSPGTGTVSTDRKVTCDLWMPWSADAQSAIPFRDKVDAVEWALVTNRSLGVCAKMLDMPILEFNRIEPYASNNQNDTSRHCHHARIAFHVIGYVPVSAS